MANLFTTIPWPYLSNLESWLVAENPAHPEKLREPRAMRTQYLSIRNDCTDAFGCPPRLSVGIRPGPLTSSNRYCFKE